MSAAFQYNLKSRPFSRPLQSAARPAEIDPFVTLERFGDNERSEQYSLGAR